ncbi:MAG: hypothetical protein FWF38_04865 [Spirochaetaceae bacterium]|nr:hypothetical protein [Spirochaetaceae bacterium]
MSLFHILVGAAALKVLAAKTPDKKDEEIDDILEKLSEEDNIKTKKEVEKNIEKAFANTLANRLFGFVLFWIQLTVSIYLIFFKEAYSYPILAIVMSIISSCILIRILLKPLVKYEKNTFTLFIIFCLISLAIFITGFFLGSFIKWLYCTIWAVNFILLYDSFAILIKEIQSKVGFNFSATGYFHIILFVSVGYLLLFIIEWMFYFLFLL